jgi:anti-sigma28 factor (negative regulator of flagellin synthesis)
MIVLTTDYEISATSPTKITPISTEREGRTQAVQEPKYDSVTISSQTTESRFQKELVSRLEKEVRTSVSTGNIQKLKQQVDAGEYVPDPMRIAGKILMLDEEDL